MGANPLKNDIINYMEIGFFTDCYLPFGFGVGTSIESFRKNLETLGHKVYVFAPFFKDYQDKNPRVFRFHSLKVIKEPEIRLASPFFPLKPFKEIKDLKLDIAHAHTPFSLGILGKYLASQQKIPLLYTHHTQYPEYAKFYLKEKFLIPYLAQSLTVWFSNISDAVIAPSEKIKKILKEAEVKKTIYVLPTGVNTDIFRKASLEEKNNLRKKFRIPIDLKILLFVGRMGKEKNAEFLLHVLKKIIKENRNVYLLMVGEGPYLKQLRQIAKQLQINPWVKFTGSVSYEEITKYYQMADIFVFASLTDTQGIVILEAAASGLSIVALEDAALENIVVNNKNGFLIKPDQKEKAQIFAKKILKIFNSSFLCQKFSKNSLTIANQFSEINQTKKLVDIYQKVIKLKNL